MIQPQTYLNVADNSRARKLMCIRIIRASNRQYAHIGVVIVAVIKEAVPNMHLLPNNEEFEPRFSHGQSEVLVYLTQNLNVKNCPLKREILNELIVNSEILLSCSFFLLDKIVIVEKMEFQQ